MSGWRIFKTVAKRKAQILKEETTGFFKKKPEKEMVDKELPLSLHIDGKIELEDVPFLIHGANLKTTYPGKTMEIPAYGVFHAAGATVHRFYLEGDGNEAMLQVVINDKMEMEETRLFVSIDEVYPESTGEWGVWLDEGDGLIGWSAFQHKDDERLYHRAWDKSDNDWVPPVSFTETVYLDRFGETSVTVKHSAMLYGRFADEAEETAEYTLVTAEEHSDGKALVHIMCGIDFEPGFINVLY